MASNVRWLVIGAAALAAGGCSDLHQSALVYSSQNNIGVVLKGGSAQAGNVDLTLGYSGHDFAIVPIAVAGYCEVPTDQPDCDPKKYRLVQIQGKNNIDAAAVALAALATQLSKQSELLINERGRLQKNLDGMIQNLREINSESKIAEQITDLETQKALLEQSLTSSDPDTSSINRSIASLNAEILNKSTRQREIETLKTSNTEALRRGLENRIAALEEQESAIATQLSGFRNSPGTNVTDMKIDALSVYGEFGGGTNVDGTKASLSVGKVFSTGVAAQNFTQQIGTALALQNRTKCVAAATSVINSDARLVNASIDQLTGLYQSAFLLCTATDKDKPK